MARGTDRSATGRPALHELDPNGEPPQPTLAAQLVNRITSGERPPRKQDEETFKQLLREVLENENVPSTTARQAGTNLEVNYKLIYVIVKAGLDPANHSNPFDQRDDPIKRACESLDAIRITLRQAPNVLFSSAFPGLECSAVNPPLMLWLFPKVLALLTLECDEQLKAACDRFFESALSLEKRVHLKNIKRKSLFRYLCGCIQGP